MPFAIIVLSAQRKFLSRKVCTTALEVGEFVARVLQNDVVGSLSIKRMVPKAEPESSDSPN